MKTDLRTGKTESHFEGDARAFLDSYIDRCCDRTVRPTRAGVYIISSHPSITTAIPLIITGSAAKSGAVICIKT